MDCPTCGKTLATERGMRQHHTKVHGDSLPNRTCGDCGVEFYDPKSRRTYCDDCYSEEGANNGNYSDATEQAACRICGASFEYYLDSARESRPSRERRAFRRLVGIEE